ncbi:MAG: YigZ family protein, partial [Chitinophagaceae bacterium]
DRNKLTNILLIVVRYFGGSLLGLPGLTQAYKSTAASVLEKVQIIRKSPEATWKLEFPYARLNEVMRVVKAAEITLLEKHIGLKCILHIRLPLSIQDKWLGQIKEIWEVAISPSC